MESNERFNKMQSVKRRMFAMRNGIIADTMRKAGSPFQIIFGLNLPQITDIAKEFAPNQELAEKLWANTTTRESMLIAPMLVEPAEFSIDQARLWISQVPCAEVADILCLKLLRKLPYAMDIVDEFCTCDDSIVRYTALRLMCNLASSNPEKAYRLGEGEITRTDNPHKSLALRLMEYNTI